MTLDLGTPNIKQAQCLSATERYVAYGGARGGGKSWTARTKATLMCLAYPRIRILLLRRTYKELEENHITPLRMTLKTDAKDKKLANYNDSKKVFVFANESRIVMGYMDAEKDVLQYQGQEYDLIMMDEATHFTEFQFQILKGCLRGANDYPKRMYLFCNPGGVGHAWVRRLFIDQEYLPDEDPSDYRFIQALVYDNTVLMDKDPEYVKGLESLPENLKKAWLYGSWDIFEGQYFPEFNRDVHVIEPIQIPSWWRKYTTIDYGLDMLAFYWIAVDEQNNSYVVNELYESGLIVSDAVAKIKEYEQALGWTGYITRCAPPDLWNTQSALGKSTAILFDEAGLPLDRSNNDRVDGWMAVKELLKVEDRLQPDGTRKKEAQLKIFRNCSNLIRCIGQILTDEKNPNDCAKEPHELTHAPDSLRYYAIAWTSKAYEPLHNSQKPKLIDQFKKSRRRY